MKYLRLNILIVSIVGIFDFVNAQVSADQVFDYAFTGSNAYIRSVKVDTNGNSYILGSFNTSFTYQGNTISGTNNQDGQNYFIMKTTTTGELVYLKSIVSENGMGLSVNRFDVNNGGEVALVIESSQDSTVKCGDRVFDSDSLKNFNLVTKITQTGFVAWMRIIWPYEQMSYLTIRDVEISDKGDVFVTGNFMGEKANFGTVLFNGFNELYENPFLAKYDGNGELDWVESVDNIVDPGTSEPYGYITFSDVETDTTGNIYLSGTYEGVYNIVMGDTLNNEGNGSNGFLAKMVDGNTKFSAAYGYESDGQIYPQMIRVGEDGRILFAFYYNTNYGTLYVNDNSYTTDYFYNLMVCNFNVDMSYRWENSIKTEKSYISGDDGAAVGYDPQGDVLFSARGFYTKIINGKINDASGDTVWTLSTSEDYNLDYSLLTVDRSGNIVFTGQTYTNVSVGSFNIVSTDDAGVKFFVRILNSGKIDYIYQKQCNTGTDILSFNGIGTDAFGNIHIAGTFSGSEAKIDALPLSNDKQEGIFLTKYGHVTNISGQVLNPYGNPVTEGIVVLIGYSYYQRSPVSDSVDIGSGGEYSFTHVPFGNYIILAVPDAEYFPTYYPSKLYWEGASVVEISEPTSISDMTILCHSIPVLSGSNGLSGSVSEVDSDDIFKAVTGKAKPKAKAMLSRGRTLPKSTHDIIATTESDESGYFVFTNLEDGDYTLFIEIAGLPNTSTHQVTVQGGTFIVDLDFYVNEAYIEAVNTSTSQIQEIETEDLSVLIYPNPSRGMVTIESASSNKVNGISIYDIQGRKIKSLDILSESVVEVENLESGLYFINVKLQNGVYTTKLIVQP